MSADAYAWSGGTPQNKAIVLFSDGTGNSSAKLFKTNVWRMYEAVDLGPAAPDRRQQIAYYDDGVGTSSFKPLAVLGGVFGYGLKRNVLDIYKYACRNYKAGDDLYAFGFSRGAFTIRLAVALIASEGLVQSEDEGELDRQAQCAYRAFRRLWLPRRLHWPTKQFRRIRDSFIKTSYDKERNLKPVIQFIGVWDTVSAYGGPIAELTRAIDNWIFRLSTPDYELNPAVKCARHALALDDERDSFHPLLWDEVYENKVEAEALAANPNATRRMQQVWFTGMHSDVGGGYPDESLSYVSLLWMMEEAEKAGLNTLKVIKDRFFALASSAGPIHDSRTGAAGYYRYQPRKIAAWLNPIDDRTAGLRDPAIVDAVSRQQKGLLMEVKVHESVIHRISCGTDRYAPITLPETFTIVPPQAEGENKPQADSVAEAGGEAPGRGQAAVAVAVRPQRLVSQALRGRLEAEDVQKARAAAFEAVWDLVWHKRVAYFITMGFTLLLVTMPLWIAQVSNGGILADGRTWIDAPIRAVGGLLPAMFHGWIDTFANNPFYTFLLAACIWATMRQGAARELELRDLARRIWHAAADIKGAVPQPAAESGLTRFRNRTGYQNGMQVFKWRVLPDFVFLPLILFVVLWLGAGGVTQAYLPWLESGTALCTSPGGSVPRLVQYDSTFKPGTSCHPVRQGVEVDKRYRVELRVDAADPWFDGSHPTDPKGLRARDLGPAGILGGVFRRVIEANFLQPVIEIRQPPGDWRLDNAHITPLELEEKEPRLFVGEFTAGGSGELFIFANDAVSLLHPTYFYTSRLGKNHGSAALKIVLLEEAPPPTAGVVTPAVQARAGGS
jgi:uncharacterized protein (DUF2235 family)